ncbi:MAG: DUF1223 domain-containing protein [Solirubrobacterales bacterium]
MTGLKTSLLAGAMLAATLGAASAQPLTVVELFTSQGCSSCPPANANLIKVKDQPGVLALSFNVTYWDYLGWKDTFGRKEFTDRQVTYEPSLGRDGPFTPQVVVNGSHDAVGAAPGEIQGLIANSGHTQGPELSLDKAKVSIGAGKAPGGGADIWLVRYTRGVVEVPVARGENTGRTPAARQCRARADEARQLERRGHHAAAACGHRRPKHRGVGAGARRRTDPGRRRQLIFFPFARGRMGGNA